MCATRIVAIVACLVFLPACAFIQKINPWHRNIALEEIAFESTTDANGGIAFDVHLVFVLDEFLAQEYAAYTSHNWFSGIDSGRIRANTRLAIKSFDFPAKNPLVKYYEVPREYNKAWGVLVFTNYINADFPALSVGEFEKVKVVLSQSNVTPDAGAEEE